MNQKRALATGVSLLLGALTGVVVGMNERGGSSSGSDAAVATAGARAATRSELAASQAAPSPQSPPAPAPPELSAAPPDAPPPPAASSAALELTTPPSPAFDLTPPATKEELLAVETRCTRSVPEDCERGARALNEGKLLARDPGRAKMLNRIALTVYVKQCESDRALACARLAEMHERGEIVQKNPGTAKALRARFQELCGKKPAQTGCKAPSG